jgi:hypothetical protein
VLVYKWARKLLRGEGHWVAPYEEWGFRRGLAETMRWWADKIGPEDAYIRHTGLRFAHRVGVGTVIYVPPGSLYNVPHVDRSGCAGRGVELHFRKSDYEERSWEENEHAGSNPRPR